MAFEINKNQGNQRTNNSYASEISTKESKVNSLELGKSIFVTAKSNTENELSSAQADNIELNSAISSAKEALNNANADVAFARQALSSAKSTEGIEIPNEDGSVTMDYSYRDALIAQAQAQLDSALQAQQQAQQELIEKQNQYQELLSDIESFEQALDEYNENISSAQLEIDTTISEIEDLKAKQARQNQQSQETQKKEEDNNSTQLNNKNEKNSEELLDKTAINALMKIASEYTKRDNLSDEEYGEIITLKQIANNYQNLDEQFELQKNSEGCVDYVYNALKDITNLGISKKMVQEDFDNYKGLTESLTSAINNDEKEAGQYSAIEFANRVNNCENFQDKFNVYKSYYQNDEDAINAFNKYINNNKQYAEYMAPSMFDDIRLAKENDEIVFQIKYSEDENYLYDEENLNEEGYISYGIDKEDFALPLPIENIFTNGKIEPNDVEKTSANDFKSIYKFWTGQEYSQDNVNKYINDSYAYSQVNIGIATAYNTEEMLKDVTLDDAIDTIKELQNCSEDDAILVFNEYYQSIIDEQNPDIALDYAGNKLTSAEAKKNDKGQIEYTLKFESDENNPDSLYAFQGYNGKGNTYEITYNPEEYLASDEYNNDFAMANLTISQINNDVAKNEILQKRYTDSYEAENGKSIDEVISDYEESYTKVFGESELRNTLNSYINDMDSYSQKVSAAVSMGGIGIGFFCPVVGGVMALGGSFADNGIDALNMASNNTKNEDWQGLVKDTLKEASFIAIGMGIGKTASSANSLLSAKLTEASAFTSSQISVIGTGTEVLLDGSLGIGFDYLTTGDFNLSGNSLSVFLDIMSGVRGYKALESKKVKSADVKPEIIDGADNATMHTKNSDIETTTKYTGEESRYLSADEARPEGRIETGEGETINTKSADADNLTELPHNGIENPAAIDVKPETQIKIDDATIQKRTLELEAMNVESSYIKDITKLTDEQYKKCLSLMENPKIDPYYARQLSKLEDATIDRALNLLDNGMPASRIADSSVLTGEQAQRVDQLMADEQISKYYIGELAVLDDENFATAMRLIKDEKFSAPNALDVVSKPKNKQAAKKQEILTNPKERKIELTPEVEAELEKQAINLYNTSTKYINEAQKSVQELTNPEDILSARPKGIKSTLNKLMAKYEKGLIQIEGNTPEGIASACKNAIGDSYGTRIQIRSLTPDESIDIIRKTLKQEGFETVLTPEQFIDSIKSNTIPEGIENFDTIKTTVINTLKEAQTDEIVDKLIKDIIAKRIEITELNNYGNDISSYFTDNQLFRIAKAVKDTYGGKLKIVTKWDNNGKGILAQNDTGDSIKKFEYDNAVIKPKGAVKDSGYTSSQMNVTHKFGDKTTGNGELQIRGTEVNAFGDVEHIPYDIRQGKITAKDTEYSEVYNLIKNMDENSYKSYNKYLTDTYDYLRLKELGIEIPQPSIPCDLKLKSGDIITNSNILSMDGLIKLNKKIHG